MLCAIQMELGVRDANKNFQVTVAQKGRTFVVGVN
jgi:hypothetical protein